MWKESKKMTRCKCLGWGWSSKYFFNLTSAVCKPLCWFLVGLPVSGEWTVSVQNNTFSFQYYLLVKYCNSFAAWLILPKPLLTLLNVPFTTSSCIWQCGLCSCLLKSSSTVRCLRRWLHSCLTVTMGRAWVAMLRGMQGKQVNCWHLLLLYWNFYSGSFFHLVFLFHRL